MGVKKWNWLNKFMHVEVDMKCMETNFSGRVFCSFADFAPFSFAFKTGKISLRTVDYKKIELTEEIHASRD